MGKIARKPVKPTPSVIALVLNACGGSGAIVPTPSVSATLTPAVTFQSIPAPTARATPTPDRTSSEVEP